MTEHAAAPTQGLPADWGPGTRAIHAGQSPDPSTGAVILSALRAGLLRA